MTKYLGRTKILDSSLRTLEVDMPEWGGKILIRELSAADVMLATALRDQDVHAFRISATYVICAAVDEQMKPLFTNDDIDEVLALGYDSIDRLTRKILIFSDMLEDEKDEDEDTDPN